MSRLDYAPKLKEIKVTDIQKGLGVFTPKPDKAVSFAALKETLKKAGYTLDSAFIIVTGTLEHDETGWWLVSDSAAQRFFVEQTDSHKVLAGAQTDSRYELRAEWKTVGEAASVQEVLTPRSITKLGGAPKAVSKMAASEWSNAGLPLFRFERAAFKGRSPASFPRAVKHGPPNPLAPIRTTSPGLTVYKGGAITSRLYLIRQHLGALEVGRQVLDISASYTPTPRLQLEVEVPVARTTFDDGMNSGSGVGFGNITLWSKFRFFRKVKTYGDRQASLRFGMELPTGKKSAPNQSQVKASAFVRQQLTPISGGLSPHVDLSFSQAGGRVIFGGNIEGIVRSERAGFRMGHEVRVNTDLEYVLFPRDYRAPGKEVFAIFETTLVHRGRGHVDSLSTPGSSSTEFYVAPGLQFAADPRVVFEGSVQLPLVRNTGPEVLRNRLNVLLGLKYLF